MIKIDMWYGDKREVADKVDVTFSDLDCVYRGNIYKNGKMIGDYTCNNVSELGNAFPQVTFYG